MRTTFFQELPHELQEAILVKLDDRDRTYAVTALLPREQAWASLQQRSLLRHCSQNLAGLVRDDTFDRLSIAPRPSNREQRAQRWLVRDGGAATRVLTGVAFLPAAAATGKALGTACGMLAAAQRSLDERGPLAIVDDAVNGSRTAVGAVTHLTLAASKALAGPGLAAAEAVARLPRAAHAGAHMAAAARADARLQRAAHAGAHFALAPNARPRPRALPHLLGACLGASKRLLGRAAHVPLQAVSRAAHMPLQAVRLGCGVGAGTFKTLATPMVCDALLVGVAIRATVDLLNAYLGRQRKTKKQVLISGRAQRRQETLARLSQARATLQSPGAAPPFPLLQRLAQTELDLIDIVHDGLRIPDSGYLWPHASEYFLPPIPLSLWLDADRVEALMRESEHAPHFFAALRARGGGASSDDLRAELEVSAATGDVSPQTIEAWLTEPDPNIMRYDYLGRSAGCSLPLPEQGKNT